MNLCILKKKVLFNINKKPSCLLKLLQEYSFIILYNDQYTNVNIIIIYHIISWCKDIKLYANVLTGSLKFITIFR